LSTAVYPGAALNDASTLPLFERLPTVERALHSRKQPATAILRIRDITAFSSELKSGFRDKILDKR
jgi:hypothetical protein